MTPTFFIRTYGCQMNERDSEAVACLLETRGFHQVEGEDEADVLLFNTCSVRDQAERKVLGKLGLLKRLKRVKPHLVIGVLGCMAQRLGEEIPAKLPHVDLVVGTDQIQTLPDLLLAQLEERRPGVYLERSDASLPMLGLHAPGKISAFIAVMRGCNQGCSYCVVPEVRGREKSRPVTDIVEEETRLVAGGTQEIFLLGQNITAYGVAELRRAGTWNPELSPFADLLRAVCAVPGLRRVRFTSPHPNYMNAAFVRAVAELPRVCDHFHVPVQSGSDRILQAMKRNYTAAAYLERIRALREARPGAAFSTDVIVGFPGETDEDFAATRELMQTADFDMAYIFKYSPRPGTLAERQVDDVPQAVKKQRNEILLKDLDARSLAHNTARVGEDVEVLAEGPSLRNRERWSGRSSDNKNVIFTPEPGLEIGQLRQVRITRATSHSLFGDLLPE